MRKLFFLIVAWFCLAGLAFGQEAAAVIFASGNVQIVAADGTVRAATRGNVVNAGDTIETGDGKAQVRFRDGATMSLQPATRFRLDDFRFSVRDGKAGPDDRSFFSLLKGGFRTITGLIGKEKRSQYRVSTTVATIGIRGTDYSARLVESGLAVTTFGGLVEVCNDGGCVLVAPGQTATVNDRNQIPGVSGERQGLSGAIIGVPELPKPEVMELPLSGGRAPVLPEPTTVQPAGGSVPGTLPETTNIPGANGALR